MSRSWKILDYGEVDPKIHASADYACMNCMIESILPVKGLAIAQVDTGIVFDIGSHAIPAKIKCPWCRTIWQGGAPDVR